MSTIEHIKGAMTVRQLWQKLELPGLSDNPKKMNLCPFHQEKSPSCSLYKGDTRFKCFGCGEGGSVIDFYRCVMSLPDTSVGVKEAVRALATMLNLQQPEHKPLQQVRERASVRLDMHTKIEEGKRVEDIPQDYLDWATGKGISAEIVQHMLLSGDLSFEGGKPHYHYNTGVKVRFDINSSKSSRWMDGSPQGGLWRAKQITRFSAKRVIMCEGESDTMMAFQASGGATDEAVVGIPQASWLPSPALASLIGSGRDVFLCFDNDIAGAIATERITALLHEHADECRVFSLPWSLEDDNIKDLCALGEKRVANKLAGLKNLANYTAHQ